MPILLFIECNAAIPLVRGTTFHYEKLNQE